MAYRWNWREHALLAVYLLKWLAIAAPAGAAIGSAVALFLCALERATVLRWDHPWLLWLLPAAGAGVGAIYHVWGKSVEAGNNLIIDRIHEPGGGVPARMAPLVLIGTVVTHLFGGSAGREGTAVQMGGSLAGSLARLLRLPPRDVATLLQAGVAGGFGAVFGTPLAGTVFALEVLSVGVLRFDALLPCLICAAVGDLVTRAWGIHHTAYAIAVAPGLRGASLWSAPHVLLLGKIALAAAAFGLASVAFAELTHGLGRAFKRYVPFPPLRPVIGGAIVIALALTIGPDYLGLGVTADPHHPQQVSIVSCFHPGGATAMSWAWKILFTAVTLGSGFKGGEVTPLFFVGAALGNALARPLHAPADLMAGLGFVAVFAGATNTPLACTIMGVELFAGSSPDLLRSGFAVDLAVACFTAYLLSGRSGIYTAQRREGAETRNDER